MTYSNYPQIRTPIDTLNVLSCGGLHQGTFSVLFGRNSSGKSACSYMMAAYFLQDNPTGVVHILDTETSTDLIRLKYTFGIDMSRVVIRGVRDIEEGFQYINEICEGKHEPVIVGKSLYRESDILEGKLHATRKIAVEWETDWNEDADPERKKLLEDLRKKGAIANPGAIRPHYVLWDSISATSPKLEMDAALRGENPMNSGGMGLAARVLKTNLKATATLMYGKPVTVVFIAQVMMTDFGSPQGPSETFAGGSALQHYCHYILYFEFRKKLKEDGDMANKGTLSRVKIQKSKFSPTSQGVHIIIDDTLGGRIVQKDEAILVCMELGIITGSGWYKFKDEPEGKAMRMTEMSGNEEIRRKCIDKLARYYRLNYLTIDMMYQEAGNPLGNITDEERKLKWSNSSMTLGDPSFILEGNKD